MTDESESSKISIDEQTKARLQELYKIFDFLTNADVFEKNKDNLAKHGVYPIYMGQGGAKKLHGVRLGKSAVPAQSGSVCLQGMIHTNEPAGLAGLQAALDWWNELDGKHKDKVSGDVYLLFAGEHVQAQHFFDRMLHGDNAIDIKEMTDFRVTADQKTNRNRLPAQEPAAGEGASQKALWEDYQWLKENIYSKCATTKDGDNVGFILGLHTFSQAGEETFFPYFFPFPEIGSPEKAQVVAQIKNHTSMLAAMLGAKSVMIEDHNARAENYFEGVTLLDLQANNVIPAGSAIRATLECGQHLDPKAAETARNAVFNALKYKFGPELVHAAQRPAKHTMAFSSDTQMWFAPASVNASRNPKEHREWLAPPLEKNEAYGMIHLITGNELTENEKAAKPQESSKPRGFGHLSDEVWQMIACPRPSQSPKARPFSGLPPAAVWDAIVQAPPGQLANETNIKQGQCIAFMDIVDAANRQVVRQELLYAPHGGICSMFPRNPDIHPDQPEDMALISQQGPEVIVEFPKGEKSTDWIRSTGKSSFNNVKATELITQSGSKAPQL